MENTNSLPIGMTKSVESSNVILMLWTVAGSAKALIQTGPVLSPCGLLLTTEVPRVDSTTATRHVRPIRGS